MRFASLALRLDFAIERMCVGYEHVFNFFHEVKNESVGVELTGGNSGTYFYVLNICTC